MPRPISLVVDTPGTFKDSKGGHVLCFVFRNNLAFNVLFIYGGLYRNLAANNYSHYNARYRYFYYNATGYPIWQLTSAKGTRSIVSASPSTFSFEPSPTGALSWLRGPFLSDTGSPPVAYLTRTNTTGGVLASCPPGEKGIIKVRACLCMGCLYVCRHPCGCNGSRRSKRASHFRRLSDCETWEAFEEHFKAAGLQDFVEYNQRKRYDMHCQELQGMVKELSSDDPPRPAAEIIQAIKSKKEECGLQDVDIVKFVYMGLVDGVLQEATGRNTQQTQFLVLRTLKAYHKVLLAVCLNARLEAVLLSTMQVTCYEDSRLLKLFADMVKVLYDVEVVGEDTIRFWYTKGANPKGRNVFLRDLEPMMKWLDEAEEEEEE